MNRLDELMLYVLDRAQKGGRTDLSKFQMFKIPYLLQVYALKYAGTPLVDVSFVREQNGPISPDIYQALERLEKAGFVNKEVIENEEYGYPRYSYSLGKKKVKEFSFDQGEKIFLDNFLSELLPLTQKALKEKAYSTEPMINIVSREKEGILKGQRIDFSMVSVDPDVVDVYSDA